MAQGFFITLEGGEGSGKSTQVRLLAEALRAAGREVVLTREPGGAPGAEAIRSLLVTGEGDRWSPLSEALLFAAAREDHLRSTILPALGRGAVVISDRFADSTRVYQGAAGGLGEEIIDALERWVVGPSRPDVTFILDLDAAAGLRRAGARGEGEDRFERMDMAFHQRLRQAYLALAADDPARCVVIDAARETATIAAELKSLVLSRIAAGQQAAPNG